MIPSNTNTHSLHTVERKIRHIAMSMGDGVEYLFMNWAQTNVAIDKITKPTIVYILPPAGELDFSWSNVKDYPEAKMAFLANTDFDFDGSVNDGIIEALKRLSIRFVRTLNESGLFATVEGRVSYQVVYDHLDDNVTGIILTLPLIEEHGIIICDEIEREEDD